MVQTGWRAQRDFLRAVKTARNASPSGAGKPLNCKCLARSQGREKGEGLSVPTCLRCPLGRQTCNLRTGSKPWAGLEEVIKARVKVIFRRSHKSFHDLTSLIETVQ
ncbi:hypothetical protein Zmor_020302 [Zophobas morio]|uniref:Uncharacterized protein n=1 Tax=Zophobas morio TaxID=2755281 RepID=A0AA38M9V3_9CUCU|nr:hypothetical protein Zmor_020302 [Zophobas morio]